MRHPIILQVVMRQGLRLAWGYSTGMDPSQPSAGSVAGSRTARDCYGTE